MNYEASIHLSDEKFRRLVGVSKEQFHQMLACLEQAQATVARSQRLQYTFIQNIS